VLRFGRLAWRAWEQFARDHCLLLAAALSFYGVVSLIPLCFLMLWALSHWFGPEEAYQMVAQLVHQHVPQAAEVILGRVQGIRQDSARWMTGSLWGLLPLVWAGWGFYETLERILTEAWAGRPLRGYLQRKLITLMILLGAGIFFIASLLMTTALTAFLRFGSRFLGLSPQDFSWLWHLTARLLPFVFSVTMFFLLYKFLPNTKVPARLAIKAAAVAGILWELSKSLFTRFIARGPTFQHLYGSLTGVVVLMFWIYFSAVILLLGAELAAAYHFDESGEGREPTPPPTPGGD
jgi:membrane protein